MCYLKKLWTLSRPWIYILWVALTTVSCPKRRSSIWRHFWLMRRLDTAAVMYTFLHREWNSDVKESLLLNFGITVWLQISKKIFLFTSDDAKQVCERSLKSKTSKEIFCWRVCYHNNEPTKPDCNIIKVKTFLKWTDFEFPLYSLHCLESSVFVIKNAYIVLKVFWLWCLGFAKVSFRQINLINGVKQKS